MWDHYLLLWYVDFFGKSSGTFSFFLNSVLPITYNLYTSNFYVRVHTQDIDISCLFQKMANGVDHKNRSKESMVMD